MTEPECYMNLLIRGLAKREHKGAKNVGCIIVSKSTARFENMLLRRSSDGQDQTARSTRMTESSNAIGPVTRLRGWYTGVSHFCINRGRCKVHSPQSRSKSLL